MAAMRSPRGASAELLRRILSRKATMLLSVALALEYEAKCMLAEHRLAAGLTESETRVCIMRGFAEEAARDRSFTIRVTS